MKTTTKETLTYYLGCAVVTLIVLGSFVAITYVGFGISKRIFGL